jgi:organic radical activating enzyme
MPNLIINNYCNQKCSYCFANENMKDISLQNDMSLLTYLNSLKYLKNNDDNFLRILWWEPTISKNFNKFILIWKKAWFDIIVFSNINIETNLFKKAFKWIENIRVNCNINNKDFYSIEEIKRIKENISFLKEKNINIILWYNIDKINVKPDFIYELAEDFKIKNIILKITNSSIWEKLLIDNSNRNLWIFIFNEIKNKYKEYNIEISCWLNKDIFIEEEINFINTKTSILLKFWCDWNIWKFDINTDWSIIKCFPLESLFKKNRIYIKDLISKNTKYKTLFKIINNWNISNWECVANKKIKSNMI